MKSKRELAEQIGLHPNTFHVIKTSQPEKYNFILNLHQDIDKGYLKYIKLEEEVLKESQKMYWWLIENRLMFKFSKLLHKLSITGNDRSLATSISKTIFKIDNKFGSFNTFIKYSKILKVYQKFKKEHKNEVYTRNDIEKEVS